MAIDLCFPVRFAKIYVRVNGKYGSFAPQCVIYTDCSRISLLVIMEHNDKAIPHNCARRCHKKSAARRAADRGGIRMQEYAQAIAFARQEYLRQGLDSLYGRTFDELLLPELAAALPAAVQPEPVWTNIPKTDLLAALLRADQLRRRYLQKKIDLHILQDTLDDIGRWARTYFSCSGAVGLAEVRWLSNHLNFRLFQLGRLQFCMEPADFSAPDCGIQCGEPLVSVHICAGAPLTPDLCDRSFALARAFFQKYFPEYPFRFFSCHSWLLDAEILSLVPEGSNIALFQKRFRIVARVPSDAIARYVFRWNIRPEELAGYCPKNSFQQQLKTQLLAGKQFYEATGILAR